MRQEIVDRVRAQISYELQREGPPDGFPKFPDIPRERYTNSEFYALEKELLWPKVWMYVGRVEDVPEAGSYFTWDDAGIPLLIVRGKDLKVRAFYNSCRHRGAPVVREACGKASILRCQYHSWAYDTQGHLVSYPSSRDFVDLIQSERSLGELRCEIFDGWIFVNQDPDALPLVEFLGPVADELQQMDGNNLQFLDKTTYIIEANWKVAIEAFLEVYHFPHIHKPRPDWGMGAFDLDINGAAIDLMRHGQSRMVVPFTKPAQKLRGMKDGLDWDVGFGKDGPFPDIPSANDMVRSTSLAYGVFPNMTIPVEATGFPFLVFWPIDIRTTKFDVIHFAPKWGDGDPPGDWETRLAGFDGITKEDQANMAPIQKSLEAPSNRGIPLNYQERRIWHLHEQVDRVIGAERIPTNLRVPELLADYIVG